MPKTTSQILMAAGFCHFLYYYFLYFFFYCCGKCLSSALSIYIASGFSWTARLQFPWKEPQSWPSSLPSCLHFPSLLSFKISILIIMHVHKLSVTRHQFLVVWLLFVVVVVSFGLACFVFLWMAAILFLRAHRTATCLSYPLSHSQPWDTNKPQNDSGLLLPCTARQGFYCSRPFTWPRWEEVWGLNIGWWSKSSSPLATAGNTRR